MLKMLIANLQKEKVGQWFLQQSFCAKVNNKGPIILSCTYLDKSRHNKCVFGGLAAKLQTPIVIVAFPIIIGLLSAAIEVYGSPMNAMVKSCEIWHTF